MGREQRDTACIARQGLCHLIYRVFTLSYLRQYPVCLSDLLSQEAGGFTFDNYGFFSTGNFPPEHFPHRAAVLRMPHGQGPEVMDAHQELGCLRHLLCVEALPDPEMGVPPQGRWCGPVQYTVLVGPTQGASSGVELLVYPVGPNDVDVVGKMVIERWGESFQGVLGRGEEIHHLALGMGPGVGAAGAPDPGWLARELGQGFFQLPLDRRVIGLKLESGVFRPLVFNQKGGPPKLPARSAI